MRLKNKDIAKALGISTAAVSLALNGKPGVSEETRKRVLEMVSSSTESAVQQLEDKENATNRSILMSVHRKTGLIMNDKPFFSDIVEAAQQELIKKSYNMVLAHYSGGQDLSSYIQYLKSLPISGIILMATELDEVDLTAYLKLNKPIVLMDGMFDLAEVDSVTLDNQAAILREIDYAVKMGHREIGFLRSKTPINNFRHHYDGFLKGIRDYHLESYSHPIIDLPCDVEGAYSEMSDLLDHLPETFRMPTIFLADLDYIALGAMTALKEHGYKIPDDVSIMGYDDIATSAVSEPPLTTILVNHRDIGRFSAALLLDRIQNPRSCHISMQISSQLIIRQSVRKLG